jgi:hypothetical protein
MRPRMEKARIGWWIHTPGGRRMWCATRWWAERELRGYDECWAIAAEHWPD